MNYSNNGNFELENGYSQEVADELLPEFEINNESEPESSNQYAGTDELPYELSPEFESSYNNGNNELELENQLLQLTNEFEFGNWLKRLAQKGGQTALNYLNSSNGQQVVSSLGNIAQKTLSGVGQQAGSWLGRKASSFAGENIGNQIAQYGNSAGQRLGQIAADRVPSFVRFVTDTLKTISNEINLGMSPQVRPAIIKSAAKHYPFILKVKGTLYAKPSNNFELEQPNQDYSNEAFYQGETNYEGDLNEMEEMKLASELLSVRNDQELEMFLGSLFKNVKGALSGFAKSDLAKSLTRSLKSVARKALPFLGGALGTAIPIPGVGTMLGSALGKTAGNLFGLELEGLSGEDQEFEIAKAYVRLASNAARRASQTRSRNPISASRYALIMSARRHAPGMLRLRRPKYPPVYNRYYSNYPVPLADYGYPYPQQLPYGYNNPTAPYEPNYLVSNDTGMDQPGAYPTGGNMDLAPGPENTNGESGYTTGRW